jgi:riboflavin synthase
MFTGIIETIGRLEQKTASQGRARLVVAPREPLAGLAAGESIAVNGVCLTVEATSHSDRLVFFTSSETLARTTLDRIHVGTMVNLERALRADGRLGGHLVQGHVDAVGMISRFDRTGEEWMLQVAYPAELAPFLAIKGSVAVDGISLTVAALTRGAFSVAIIPHTVAVTNLAAAVASDAVNLEVDMLARYVVRALSVYGRCGGADAGGADAGGSNVTRELLGRAGFDV